MNQKRLMPIERIPDWEKRLARQDAFWNREIIDRPVVNMHLYSPNPDYPAPVSGGWESVRDRWFDTDYIAQAALAGVMNTEYLGDSLPNVFPNLGPEIFSAYFGCELEYGEHTSWSVPCLKDWSQVDGIKFSEDNFYWKKINEITDVLLEAGKGKFYVGMTDLHPGGDAIVAFRDPLQLNIDMIEHNDEVKNLLKLMDETFFYVFDYYADKLQSAGQAITTWPGIVSTKRWHVPSNDFSCMISKQMFDDLFLPGIEKECKHAEASIYHLDGPQALQHLDSLLEIKELNAIQWVYGAGNGVASDWMQVYKKCQDAGKGLQIGIGIDEIDYFIENLKPEGLWLTVSGVRDREHADSLIGRMAAWK